MFADKEKKLNSKIIVVILFFALLAFDTLSLFIMTHPHVRENYKNFYINKSIGLKEYYEKEVQDGVDIQERLKPVFKDH